MVTKFGMVMDVDMCASTMYSIIHMQAIASHLPVTLIKDQYTGRWAHLNVKLFH